MSHTGTNIFRPQFHQLFINEPGIIKNLFQFFFKKNCYTPAILSCIYVSHKSEFLYYSHVLLFSLKISTGDFTFLHTLKRLRISNVIFIIYFQCFVLKSTRNCVCVGHIWILSSTYLKFNLCYKGAKRGTSYPPWIHPPSYPQRVIFTLICDIQFRIDLHCVSVTSKIYFNFIIKAISLLSYGPIAVRRERKMFFA